MGWILAIQSWQAQYHRFCESPSAALSSPRSQKLLLLVDVPWVTTGVVLLNLVWDCCLNKRKLSEIALTHLVLWKLIFSEISLLLRLDIPVMDICQNFFALLRDPSLNNNHHLNHPLNEKLRNYTHHSPGNVRLV